MNTSLDMIRRHRRMVLAGASVLAIGLGVGLTPHHAVAADTGCAKVNQAQGAPQNVINNAAGGGAPQNVINNAAGGGGAPQSLINQAAGGGGAPQSVINQAAGGGGAPQNVINNASGKAPRAAGTQMAENTGAKNPADCR